MPTGNRQTALNKASPINAKVKLGDTVAELIEKVNILTAAHNVLVAKMNVDAGITDTNYAVVDATVIATLETRAT